MRLNKVKRSRDVSWGAVEYEINNADNTIKERERNFRLKGLNREGSALEQVL